MVGRGWQVGGCVCSGEAVGNVSACGGMVELAAMAEGSSGESEEVFFAFFFLFCFYFFFSFSLLQC